MINGRATQNHFPPFGRMPIRCSFSCRTSRLVVVEEDVKLPSLARNGDSVHATSTERCPAGNSCELHRGERGFDTFSQTEPFGDDFRQADGTVPKFSGGGPNTFKRGFVAVWGQECALDSHYCPIRSADRRNH